MNKQSIDDMQEELTDLNSSLIIKNLMKKSLKNKVKLVIKELMNQSIRERKNIERLIKKTKTRISTTSNRLRKWSKDNPDKVINKFAVGDEQ